jgi:SAM-dependent methyltransferase
MSMLTISEREIRQHGPGNALAVCWRQWRAERALRRRGIRFRDTDPARVAAAYAAMTDGEFAAINGRQDWANWRTIPRALSGHVPDRPLRVLDLGCGTGSSTQVLAFYAPAGSHITGYEFASALLEAARRRSYCHRDGQSARVDFVCQGVTEALRAADGSLLPDRSVDVVNASGVVGHHLNADSVQPLVAELRRVLVPDGTALLDIGPTLSAAALTSIMTSAGFQREGHYRSWWGDPTGQIVLRLVPNAIGPRS